MADLNVRVVVRAVTDGLQSGMTEARRAISSIGDSATQATAVASRGFTSMRESANSAFSGMNGLFATLGLGALANDILKTNREMESLRVQLVSVTGSVDKGAEAFDKMLLLAEKTPFEIDGLTKSYVMLKNFGLEPTDEVMHSLTEQVSKLGGKSETLAGVTLALGQAWGKGKLQMQDINQMVERGVPVFDLLTKVTGKQSEELLKMSENGEIDREMMTRLIAKMGEMAEGSSARAMDTLNGRISILSDSWHKFEDTLLGDKSEGIIKRIVTNWANWFDFLSEKIAGNKTGIEGEINDINEQIDQSQKRMEKLKLLPDMIGGGMYADEAAKVEGLVSQREKLREARGAELKIANDTAKADEKALQASKELVASSKKEAEIKDWTKDQQKDIDKRGSFFDDKIEKAAKVFGYSAEAIKNAYEQASKTSGIPVNILKAQGFQESQFNPHAQSPVGARGISQFMAPTAKQYGITNRDDPIQSILAQGRYMADNMKFAGGDIKKALATYNFGSGNMRKHNMDYSGIEETREYVRIILSSAGRESGSSSTSRASSRPRNNLQSAQGNDDNRDAEKAVLKAQEEKLALILSEAKGKTITALSEIELAKNSVTYDAAAKVETLKGLKQQGIIGINEYYTELTKQQDRISNAAIAELKGKHDQLSKGDTPESKAQYEADKARILQQQDQLLVEMKARQKANNDEMFAELNAAKLKELDEGEKAALATLKIQEDESKQMLSMGKITNEQFLAQQLEFENKRFSIVKSAINARQSLTPGANQSGATEANNATHTSALNDNASAVDKARNDKFNSTFAPMSNALDASVDGVLRGQQTIQNAVKNTAQSIILSYAQAFVKTRLMSAAQWAWEAAGFAGLEAKKKALANSGSVFKGLLLVADKAKMAASWAWEALGFSAKETVKAGAKVAGETVQTTAVATGTAVRSGIEKTANATSAIGSAAKAAQGAFSWVMSTIPWPISVVLAPVAAAAAFAGTMAIGSAKGGEWSVNKDGSPYVLHENESVLPAGVAENFRSITKFVKGRVLNDEMPDLTGHIGKMATSGKLGGWGVSHDGLNAHQSARNTAEAMAGKSREMASSQINAMAKSYQQANHRSGASNGSSESNIHIHGIAMAPEEFFKQNSKHIVTAANKETRKFNSGKK